MSLLDEAGKVLHPESFTEGLVDAAANIDIVVRWC